MILHQTDTGTASLLKQLKNSDRFDYQEQNIAENEEHGRVLNCLANLEAETLAPDQEIEMHPEVPGKRPDHKYSYLSHFSDKGYSEVLIQ